MSKEIEQHIAVFGESGSGKTVLLSSFYGRGEEAGFVEKNLFRLSADSPTQADKLLQNYFRMRKSGSVPEPTQFDATPYAFTMRMAEPQHRGAGKSARFNTLKLVWHDYPGEWLSADPERSEEFYRRTETFRALLRADVAILLVDGEKLLQNAGQEEAYLRTLLINYRTRIEALKEDILDDGKPLVQFPRIWIIALSKSDLLPEIDVTEFRELVIEKATESLGRLRDLIAGMVVAPEALSVGEDFLLLSSATFSEEKIDLSQRVGVDLILPVSAVLPIERHLQWTRTKQLPQKVAENLLDGADAVAEVLDNALSHAIAKAPAKLKPVLALLKIGVQKNVVDLFVEMGREKLEEVKREALAKHEYVAAVITRFRIELDDGERDRVLRRSKK